MLSQACGASCEQCQNRVGTRDVPGQEACGLPVGGQRHGADGKAFQMAQSEAVLDALRAGCS